MEPPTKPLMKNPRQGTTKTQKATVRIMRTTIYLSPKQLPLTVLRNSRSPQKLDMLYSYNWQPMQPLGKAKGKGKGKSKKGKGKAKGKVVRSHLTLEQRREKLKSLKAKSKCMRCGALGHWAGDPECKFPTS